MCDQISLTRNSFLFASAGSKPPISRQNSFFGFMYFLKLEIPSFPMISNTCSLLKYNQVKYHVRVRAINDILCRKTCFSRHLLCCSFCDLLVVLSRRVTSVASPRRVQMEYVQSEQVTSIRLITRLGNH